MSDNSKFLFSGENMQIGYGHNTNENKLMNIPGVYFLFYRGEIVYIGKSKNIGFRITRHKYKSSYLFDSFNYIACFEKYICSLEMEYISIYKPKYNKKGINWREKKHKQSVFFNYKEMARIEAVKPQDVDLSPFIAEAVMFYIDHKLGRVKP